LDLVNEVIGRSSCYVLFVIPKGAVFFVCKL